jgi:ABC-2 type transport system ATP-binding protein
LIEVKNLKKSYGSFRALHGISFTVERGHVYGFLGPNGAGKSTTMNIITGCLAASEGSVTFNGHDIYREPIEAKKCIGYLPEQPPLYLDMKVTEYLEFVGRAKGLRGSELYAQIDEVIDLTDLGAVHNRLIKNLSKGYKQRVGIAQAMLGNPEVIILDEPTVGLDPIQIIEIRELIKSLSEHHTVILSSHIMQEISAVCDRIMIITGGRLVANDTIEGLLDTYSTTVTLEITARAPKDKLASAISGIAGVEDVRVTDTPEAGVSTCILTYPVKCDVREQVWKKLSGEGIAVLSMIPHIMSLEDIFISLTSKVEAEREQDAAETVSTVYESKADTAETEDEDPRDKDNDDNEDGDDYKPLFS